MTTKTTYAVMKRPDIDPAPSYTVHTRLNAAGVEEPAEYDDLDEAYKVAESLAPEHETAIRVTETSSHVYYL